MSTPTPYSRKRKASCLEIVVSKSKGVISRDLITGIILPMIHSKFSWDQVMGELTWVCCIVWNNQYEGNKEVVKALVRVAKIKPQQEKDYRGLAKLDSDGFGSITLREDMEKWHFINTK